VLTFSGRRIMESLPEIVSTEHTVVVVHDMQSDNTGRGGRYELIGSRIDVAGIIPPIADFLGHLAGVSMHGNGHAVQQSPELRVVVRCSRRSDRRA
jgi:hypothetical protein